MLFIDRHGEAANALLGALSDTDCADRLSRRVGGMCGKKAVAVNSTDAALHTALYLCGAERGDFVFVPSFTFYSYIATAAHMDLVPVFLDCDPHTRCVSAAALETALVWAQLLQKPPAAVVVDDAFGAVADFDVLLPLCKAWNVPLVELSAGALGGEYKGVPCGANADFGVIGFDKRVHGGGAVVLCGDDKIDEALGFTRRVFTSGENHDYSMHNAVAALDIAQLDVADKICARRRANLAAITGSVENVLPPTRGDAAEYALCKAAEHAAELVEYGYEVKMPPPVHTLPQYADCAYFEHERGFSVCESLAEYCLIGMDMSVVMRLKLIRKLKLYR